MPIETGRAPAPLVAGELLYRRLCSELVKVNFVQRMALANHLQRGAGWTDLPVWMQDAFIRIEAEIGEAP